MQDEGYNTILTTVVLEQEIRETYRPDEIGYLPVIDPAATALAEDSSVQWRADGRLYALISEDGTNTWSTLSFETRDGPSLHSIMDCLGEPKEYWAWYGKTYRGSGWSTNVLLMYPEQGILAIGYDGTVRETAEDGSLRNVASLASIAVSALVYTPPTTSEGIIARAYSFEAFKVPTARVAWYFGNIKPWPGSWEQIEVLRAPRP